MLDQLPFEIIADIARDESIGPLERTVLANTCKHFEGLFTASQRFRGRRVCAEAAAEGNLAVLRWADAAGYPRDQSSYALARYHKQTEVIDWLEKTPMIIQLNPSSTCNYIARYKPIGILKWAISQGYPRDPGMQMIAAVKGDVELLRYTENLKMPWNNRVCRVAASHGHLYFLTEVFLNHGCHCDWDDYARRQHRGTEVPHWTSVPLEKACKHRQFICEEAAAGGHLAVLQWAYNQGLILNTTSYINAIVRGHMHILDWLYEVMPMLDPIFCEKAVANGQPDVLAWLWSKNCPMNRAAVRVAAARSGNKSMTKLVAIYLG